MFKNSGGGGSKLVGKSTSPAAVAFDAAQEEDDIFAVGAGSSALHVVDPHADAAWMSGAAANNKADKKKKQYGKKANKGGTTATSSKTGKANDESPSVTMNYAPDASTSWDDTGLSSSASNLSTSAEGSFGADASTSTPVAKRTVAQGRPTPNFMPHASSSPMMAASPQPSSPALKNDVSSAANVGGARSTSAAAGNGQPLSSPTSPSNEANKPAKLVTNAAKSGNASKTAGNGGPASPKSPPTAPTSTPSSSSPGGTTQPPEASMVCSLCGAADHAKARCPVLGITLSGEAGSGGKGVGSMGQTGVDRAGKGGKGGKGKGKGGTKHELATSEINTTTDGVAAAPATDATSTDNLLASKSIDELLRSPPPSKASSSSLMATSPPSKQQQQKSPSSKGTSPRSGTNGAVSMQVSSPAPPTLASLADSMHSPSSSPTAPMQSGARSGKKKNKASPAKTKLAAGSETKSPEVAVDALHHRKPVCFVLAPSEGLYHDTGPDHQESTKRLHALTGGYGHAGNNSNNSSLDDGTVGGGTSSSSSGKGALRRASIAPLVQWIPCIGPSTRHLQPIHKMSSFNYGNGDVLENKAVDVTVSDADLLRVHDWDYLLYLRQQCAATERATVEFHQRQQQLQKSNPNAKKSAVPGGSQLQTDSSLLPPGSGIGNAGCCLCTRVSHVYVSFFRSCLLLPNLLP